MELTQYREWTKRLHANLDKDNRVLGLIALGSMAEVRRVPDDWSDHDFFVITVDSVQEDFRQNLSWLPDAKQIVIQLRETEHGLKVLYENGHLLEFAIFSVQELSLARVNDYQVIFDKANIGELMEQIEAKSMPTHVVNKRHEMDLFLSLLLVGAGRYARGEHISGHRFIKDFALRALLVTLEEQAGDQRHKLDNLDPFRRFERVFPELGVDINKALLQAPIQCARTLLNLAVRVIAPSMPDFPMPAATTVEQYLVKAQQASEA